MCVLYDAVLPDPIYRRLSTEEGEEQIGLLNIGRRLECCCREIGLSADLTQQPNLSMAEDAGFRSRERRL